MFRLRWLAAALLALPGCGDVSSSPPADAETADTNKTVSDAELVDGTSSDSTVADDSTADAADETTVLDSGTVDAIGVDGSGDCGSSMAVAVDAIAAAACDTVDDCCKKAGFPNDVPRSIEVINVGVGEACGDLTVPPLPTSHQCDPTKQLACVGKVCVARPVAGSSCATVPCAKGFVCNDAKTCVIPGVETAACTASAPCHADHQTWIVAAAFALAACGGSPPPGASSLGSL